jgi:hypothetical protein
LKKGNGCVAMGAAVLALEYGEKAERWVREAFNWK